MTRVTKAESKKVGTLAKALKVHLQFLEQKYFDEDATESAALYAKDNEQLCSLDYALSWWLVSLDHWRLP